jgi:NTE family protein
MTRRSPVSTNIPTDPVSAHLASLLTRLDVFRRPDSGFIDELAERCRLISVPGGLALIEEGDASDSLYIVVSGIFAVRRKRPTGPQVQLNLIGPGELVGEMGVITGEPRMATVTALRNSELIAISKGDLETMAALNPAVVLAVCDTVVRRLRNSYESAPGPFRPRTLCIVPHDASIDANAAAENIAGALKPFAKHLIVNDVKAAQKAGDWFSNQEKTHDFVLYVADCDATAWTRFCLRQSDCILMLARGDAAPTQFAAVGPRRSHVPENIPIDLVLLWRDRIEPGKTKNWLALLNPRAHHHVRSAPDFARTTRLAIGRGTGLVLSGGGARGLAHVGVIRALEEHNIQVDAIGGTSMGAIVAACAALEWDVTKLAKAWADTFSRQRFTDFAIPRVSIFSARKLKRTVGRWFDETRIEDAPIPFFCVSCNLMDGLQAVHRAGPFATWLQASVAIPGVLPPVIADGRVHVDGGVLNNLPADVMRNLGVSTIIAVDVGIHFDRTWQHGTSPEAGAARSPSMLELLHRVCTISSGARAEAARQSCSILLKPDVQAIGSLHWRSCEQAVEAGYRAAVENMDAIKTAVAAGAP